MSYQDWKPHLRTPASTLTKVLRSPAFLHSREHSATIAEDPDRLRALAELVETLEYSKAPLAVVADQVIAAVRFLRARADQLEGTAEPDRLNAPATGPRAGGTPSAGAATRERLLVASLHYLVTRVDLVPDFQPGGYVDDVVLLAWVFGIAAGELGPYLTDGPDDPGGEEAASVET